MAAHSLADLLAPADGAGRRHELACAAAVGRDAAAKNAASGEAAFANRLATTFEVYRPAWTGLRALGEGAIVRAGGDDKGCG
jgi:hypothetical protein